MNVLFLTLVSIEDINEQGIYHDLIKEFRNRNVNIFVVCPRERRMKVDTELFEDGRIKILKVKTGNITKTNVIEKGITTVTIEKVFLNAVKKYFKKIKFDMIIYSTPPITFYKIIEYFKLKDKAMKLGAGHPMGPFELADFIGIDICLNILENFKNSIGNSYKISSIFYDMVNEKKLGKKTKIGFYKY